jgi:hypothetical protein
MCGVLVLDNIGLCRHCDKGALEGSRASASINDVHAVRDRPCSVPWRDLGRCAQLG